ncbi:glycoside hydrolase family 32 protein [Virgibacillus siamensis]|uniref:glycoside hydrolase family 32 protein n=1 Tax=Virgibacillus siamensis TaxID=480071 RepID=UPI001FE7A9D0|nr:sucrose-6-phosphate hydrolase [Virgibacillus siamensis]
MHHKDMTNTELTIAAYNNMAAQQDTVQSDPFRLHYHIMPPIGLLNDPNGFVYFQGQYHLFYQWNPFETKHGRKFWGHVISDDLVHWKQAPIALAPDQWYDKDGCYSGSAVVHKDTMYVFYTGNVKDENGIRVSYQCLATSNDGLTFEKKGPIIHVPEGYTAHFRDPKVFQKAGTWYMVIGAQTEDEQGAVVLYTSTDLENWEFIGPFAGSKMNGFGEFGYMWECPDLFELDGNDVLIFSPQGLEANGYLYNNIYQSGYVAGTLDTEKPAFAHGGFHELDRGFDFYAPQTTEDPKGRRLLFGWMGNAEEGDNRHPTIDHRWIHAMTIPRKVTWNDGKLLQQPVEELKALRQNKTTFQVVEGLEFVGSVFESEMLIQACHADIFSIVIGKNKLTYNRTAGTFSMERQRFDGRGIEARHCRLTNLENIRIFKDTSSMEIFLNNGEEVFSSRMFDDADETRIVFQADGQIEATVHKWDLQKVLA